MVILHREDWKFIFLLYFSLPCMNLILFFYWVYSGISLFWTAWDKLKSCNYQNGLISGNEVVNTQAVIWYIIMSVLNTEF